MILDHLVNSTQSSKERTTTEMVSEAPSEQQSATLKLTCFFPLFANLTAKYIKAWLPALESVDKGQAHHPWTREQGSPEGYPAKPVTESPNWKSHYYNGPRRGGIRGGSGGRGGRGGGGRGRGDSNGRRGGHRKEKGGEQRGTIIE
jgi:hypothetical protein